MSVPPAAVDAAREVDPEAASPAELAAFVHDALRYAGAELREEGGVLHATLPTGPGTLAERLPSPELHLVFEPDRVDPAHELVAIGSHTLRRIEEHLATRGQRSFVVAPARHRLSLKALGVAAPPGERLLLEGREALEGHELYVVYRLRYRARERRDAVACVRVELRPGLAPDHPPAALATLAEPPAEVFEYEDRARKRLDPRPLRLALDEADRAITRHVRGEARGFQDELRRRAKKDLSRLHAYYAGQVAEYLRRRSSDLNQLRIEELEEERALRVKELVAGAEVAVEVEPLQLLVVEHPLQRARLERRDKETGLLLEWRWLLFDRVDGKHELGEPEAGDPPAPAPPPAPAATSEPEAATEEPPAPEHAAPEQDAPPAEPDDPERPTG
ncbi:MAG: hypothetical protein AB7N76_25895 [Planctomycetota bacterium]